jgi:ArsR family transcriptional regulator
MKLDRDLQDFLHAVAGESRQQLLLSFLHGREKTVGELVEESGLGQSTISIQLAILHRAGLLSRRKQGKEVYYRPDRARIVLLLDRLSAFLKKCC